MYNKLFTTYLPTQITKYKPEDFKINTPTIIPETSTKESKEQPKFNPPSLNLSPLQIQTNYSEQLKKSYNWLSMTVGDILTAEGITHVNGKPINFGSTSLRTWGNSNSWHKKLNPNTNASYAQDISIQEGTVEDYDTFRNMLLQNPSVVQYMQENNLGIINEITPEILARTKGTGKHFHFGPDTWAKRTWNAWQADNNVPITQMLKCGNKIEKHQFGDIIEKAWTYIAGDSNREKTFKEAFRQARIDGDSYFKWNGNLYNSELKPQQETSERPIIDFSNISTTRNRPYNSKTIGYINDKLSSISPKQRAVILAHIIEESGGDPLVTGPGNFYGLLQWGPDRYKAGPSSKELDSQIQYILDTMHNTTDRVSWTHGGEGSNFKSGKQAHDTFHNPDLSLKDINWAYSFGYVRPAGKKDSANNRLKIAEQIYELIK